MAVGQQEHELECTRCMIDELEQGARSQVVVVLLVVDREQVVAIPVKSSPV